jgi:hypothetical protein
MLRMQFGPKSSSGRIVITAKAVQHLSDDDLTSALRRHVHGIGEDRDKCENDGTRLNGCRLLNAYHTASGVGFWVITEADRSVTLLLPEDYGE